MNEDQGQTEEGNPAPEASYHKMRGNRESLLFQGSPAGKWLQGSFMTAVILGVWILWSNGLSARVSKKAGDDLAVLGAVNDFQLTNQWGALVTRKSLENQVWLADVIFSRCAGPCPRLSQKLAHLQSMLPANWPVRLVSVTADPDHDQVDALCGYAAKYEGNPDRWLFLTGDKEQLHNLVMGSFKLVSMENDQPLQPGEDQFIHSTKLVLIDKHGQIRQYFDGLEANNETAILEAVRSLVRAQ